MTALARLADALAAHGCSVRGNSAQCPGPAHASGDKNPSLSIGPRKDGTGIVIHCHLGCETGAVLEAVGLSQADLFDQPRQPGQRRVAAEYPYIDESGHVLYVKLRFVPKGFSIRQPDGRPGIGAGTRRVLYHLPQLIKAVSEGRTVYVVEGEKDVHAVEAAGGAATCNFDGAAKAGGKPKWRGEYNAFLRGADVVIIADRDEPGRAHAAAIAASLRGIAKSVRVAEAAEGKDAADHLAAGHGLGDFRPAPPDSREPARAEQAGDGLAAIAARYTPVDWHAAWKNQPDDIVWLIEPVLEAGTVNALFARPGTGKSLLALEWALRLVREGRTVLYLDDENRLTEIVERLQAMGAEPGELGRLRLYSFAALPPLDTPAGGLHLLALAAGADAQLVVLDTTSRMVQGGENDSDTFLQLYRCSLVPLKSRGIAVLRLDHPGKDDSRGQRGSSAKDGDVDTVWRLSEEAQGRRYRLIRQKSRSGHGSDTEVIVERKYVPLRHELSTGDYSRVTELAGKLEKLQIPPDANRDRCRTALAIIGVAVRNDLLSKVIKYRRAVPANTGQPGTAEQAVASLAAVPTTHVVVGTGDSHQSADPESWPAGSIGEAAAP